MFKRSFLNENVSSFFLNETTYFSSTKSTVKFSKQTEHFCVKKYMKKGDVVVYKYFILTLILQHTAYLKMLTYIASSFKSHAIIKHMFQSYFILLIYSEKCQHHIF